MGSDCNCNIHFFSISTANTQIYTLSLHDALPISIVGGKEIIIETGKWAKQSGASVVVRCGDTVVLVAATGSARSEEHTSELQSRLHLVCRLLLEKKKNNRTITDEHPICSTASLED